MKVQDKTKISDYSIALNNVARFQPPLTWQCLQILSSNYVLFLQPDFCNSLTVFITFILLHLWSNHSIRFIFFIKDTELNMCRAGVRQVGILPNSLCHITFLVNKIDM